ncbi:hypothetical protein ACJJIF_07070 [Microbulbifer sp. SSSA002]
MIVILVSETNPHPLSLPTELLSLLDPQTAPQEAQTHQGVTEPEKLSSE